MRCGYCEIGYLACPKCGAENLTVDLVEQYCPSCGLSLLLDAGGGEYPDDESEAKALREEIGRYERAAEEREHDLRELEKVVSITSGISILAPGQRQTKPSSILDGKTGVYVLHLVGTGLFKIGKSINVRKRLVSLQQAIPLPVKVVGLIECSEETLHQTEQDLHKQFKANRYKGEWFELTMEQALQIENSQKGVVK